MPYYRILTKKENRWGEGWKYGEIVAMDEESARVPLENGEIEIATEEEVVVRQDPVYSMNKDSRIGIFLRREVTGENDCASDRIRGEWIVRNSKEFTLYDPKKAYESVIFHAPVDIISNVGRIKILDVCDPVWEYNENDFKRVVASVDAVTVPTEGLRKELSKILDKPVYVVRDRHDFEHYESKKTNKHIRKAKNVVWFGYAENAHVLEPFVEYLEKKKLNLKVISQRPVGYGEFIKWNVSSYIREISKCDFALLPKNGDLKSDNKDITAYLSGIPVAKSIGDIERLIDPKERKKEMKKFKPEEYDAKYSADEYIKIIEEIKKNKLKKEDIVAYTAICGNYDKKRDDIHCFTEKGKFKENVMGAKMYKILPHKYFNCDCSIWVDGNIYMDIEPKKIVEMLGDADMALFPHPHRNCAYKEYDFAKARLDKKLYDEIDNQLLDYYHAGLPREFGLCECGMLIRKHNAVTEEFNEKWWAEICRYSHRDQMSFPYVWWKMKDRIKIKLLDGNVRNHKYFKYNVRNPSP